MVDMAAFRTGDVYLDLPFEKAKFRYEKASGKAFMRFYGKPEHEIPNSSMLYRDAISAGKVITREEYYIINPDERMMEIGPEHPYYQRVLEAQQRSGASRTKNMLFALGLFVGGVLMWLENVYDLHLSTVHRSRILQGLVAPSLIYFGVLWFFSELAGKQDPPTAEHKGSPLGVVLGVLGWPALIALHFYQLFWM